MSAKFHVYLDHAKKTRFRLVAPNGEIIAVGEGYKSKMACLKGIHSIQKFAPIAPIIDETKVVAKEPAKKAAAKKPAKKAAAPKPAAKKPAAKKAAPKKPVAPKPVVAEKPVVEKPASN